MVHYTEFARDTGYLALRKAIKSNRKTRRILMTVVVDPWGL